MPRCLGGAQARSRPTMPTWDSRVLCPQRLNFVERLVQGLGELGARSASLREPQTKAQERTPAESVWSRRASPRGRITTRGPTGAVAPQSGQSCSRPATRGRCAVPQLKRLTSSADIARRRSCSLAASGSSRGANAPGAASAKARTSAALLALGSPRGSCSAGGAARSRCVLMPAEPELAGELATQICWTQRAVLSASNADMTSTPTKPDSDPRLLAHSIAASGRCGHQSAARGSDHSGTHWLVPQTLLDALARGSC